ncbi:MAG: hypothetical protein JWM34_3701 [Ilumatobacteraceae bacterium]|nr:hypothetical protein [Ilumatobacteraceae bacterium]
MNSSKSQSQVCRRLPSLRITGVVAVIALTAGCGSAAKSIDAGASPGTSTGAVNSSVPPATAAITVPATESTPSIDTTAAAPVSTEPTASTAPPTVAAQPGGTECQASQLSLAVANLDYYMGNHKYEILVTNTSPQPCQLLGTPVVEGVGPDGSTSKLVVAPGDLYFPALGPIDQLDPGQTGGALLATAPYCDAEYSGKLITSSGLQIDLPAGGSLTTQVSFDSTCGINVGPFGTPDVDPSQYTAT